MSEHVILRSFQKRGPFHDLKHPTLEADDEIAVLAPKGIFVEEHKSGTKSPPPAVLNLLVFDGALVMEETLARQAFAGIDDVSFEPIDIHRRKQVIKGWVYVRVHRFAPLDRARSKLNLWGKGPLLSVVAGIDAAAFDRPTARIFRIVEAPRHIAVDAALAAHLAKVTKKALGPVDERARPHTFAEGYAKQKPFDVKDPRAAADAFGRLARGEEASRKDVLQHPLYALALALDVDREPRDDTRAAACGHPTTALQYALMVDRAPHESTRKAADEEVTSAYRYASQIDHEMSDALVARMEKAKYWEPGSPRKFQDELRQAKPDGPKQVATRTLPAPIKAPRFDKKAPIVDPEILSDIDEMLERGLKLIGASASDPVPDIIDKLHAYADDVRHGEVKATPRLYLALGCVLGEQIHRAFGWSWGTVTGTTPGLFSPNRAHSHIPFMLTQRVAKKGAKANTIALFFNMVADGNLPKAKPGAASPVT